MPYPNDYISMEEELIRRQQLQAQSMQQGQPYAEEFNNLGSIQTAMAQQMGSADYAELLRQGASAQKGASTTHYNPMLDYQKGNFALPEYSPNPYMQGQRPGPLALSMGQAGVGVGLSSLALKYGASRLQNMQYDPDQNWRTRVGPSGMTGAGRVAVNPYYAAQFGRQGLLSGAQLMSPMATGAGMTQMGQFGIQTGMPLWENTSPHEMYRMMMRERPVAAGGSPGSLDNPAATQTGPTMGQTGAGMAVGALTSYLINRYTNAPEGASEIAGGVAGGATTGALVGAGGGGGAAATGATGGVGAAYGAAAGGIVGGVAALGVYVLSKIVGKEVFGVGKESGKDIAARQLYRQYHGKGVQRTAERLGFEGANMSEAKDTMLAQPYAWMSQEARDFRAQNPDFDYSTGSLKERSFQQPDYKPTPWEAWVGGMHDLRDEEGKRMFKMSNIYDAVSYYGSEKGSDRRKDAAKAFARGEDFWLTGQSDLVGSKDWAPNKGKFGHMVRSAEGEGGPMTESWIWGGKSGGQAEYDAAMAAYNTKMDLARAGNLYTQEEREERWKGVQETYKQNQLPWQTEEFKKAYEEQYGGMKEWAPEFTGNKAMKKFQKKYGKESWYERHGKLDEYYRLLAEKMGTGPAARYGPTGAIRVSPDVNAATGDRWARMGVTESYDTRNIYGGQQFQGVRRTLVGNTGGEGGQDIYEYRPVYGESEEEMEYTGETER